MRWSLSRASRASPEESGAVPQSEADVYRSPGLEIALDCLPEDGSGRILDLGSSCVQSLELMGPLASHIRAVESLHPNDPLWAALMIDRCDEDEVDLDSVATDLFPSEWGRYDVILTWDILNYLTTEGVAAVARRFAELCQPGGKLFAQIVTVGDMAALPARYRIVASDQIKVTAATAERNTAPGWPFATFEKLLAGFSVECSFIMRHGVQEYVAIRS